MKFLLLIAAAFAAKEDLGSDFATLKANREAKEATKATLNEHKAAADAAIGVANGAIETKNGEIAAEVKKQATLTKAIAEANAKIDTLKGDKALLVKKVANEKNIQEEITAALDETTPDYEYKAYEFWALK